MLLHGLIHCSDDIVGVQFAVRVKIKGDPGRHRLQFFCVNVADNRDQRAGFVGWLGRVAAHRKELGYGGLRRAGRQFRVQHVLDRFQLRIIDLKGLLAAG